jgi:hypothetical protein
VPIVLVQRFHLFKPPNIILLEKKMIFKPNMFFSFFFFGQKLVSDIFNVVNASIFSHVVIRNKFAKNVTCM